MTCMLRPVMYMCSLFVIETPYVLSSFAIECVLYRMCSLYSLDPLRVRFWGP